MALTPAPRPPSPLISLVIPCFNEADSVAPFMDAVRPVLAGLDDCRFEYVFVVDGATDATLEQLVALAEADPGVTIVQLSRNFGKEAALTAGLDHAAGDAIVPIDIDLQDPPEVIAAFIAKWREGYDMVYGVRASRAADNWAKRGAARAFYALFNRFSDVKIPADAGDFRLMDRRVAEAVKRLPERNRFMKGLVAWVGFSSTAVFYDRAPRAAGRTQFNLPKLWAFALDGMAGFSTLPIRIWTYLGLVFAMGALVYAVYLTVRTLAFGADVPGYASLMVAVLIAAAMQMISVGVLGEYIGRLFTEAKARPVYLVDRIYRRPEPRPEPSGTSQP
ncbi:glycosyltransferase family 2 protein [Alkalicaulis satelles]|uniref:Glycosyltransferase family 2 protein n=1 Tax=Alkalicaulis satelles TaxID=2609175 RepID=A0A5M6ZKN1_9PROT|nr:glycosyltransferase family 2 protein [Alkalicaulis satelles]KAA5805383.1 glycosyltransferase family 2 protein [Alkalicaulis satelles]